MENNLFYYATKELSQDAFICWLCSYGLEDADKSDESLVKCADLFIREFAQAKDVDKVKLTKIEKQVGCIDVLLTVEVNGVINKIIIEDKTHSGEHDNQLVRYYTDQTNNNEKDVVVRGVYFKTGFQDDYTEVNNAEYRVFDRKKILELLSKYAENTSNNILRDYYEYWKDFEESTNSYFKKNLRSWDWRAINGFYNDMKDRIPSCCKDLDIWSGYGYVSNKSGGFWGMWYGVNDGKVIINDKEVTLYLQSEISWNYNKDDEGYMFKLCLKIENSSVGEKDIRDVRDLILGLQNKYGFTKPSRLGYGKHITVGVRDNEYDECSAEDIEKIMIEALNDFASLLQELKSM